MLKTVTQSHVGYPIPVTWGYEQNLLPRHIKKIKILDKII